MGRSEEVREGRRKEYNLFSDGGRAAKGQALLRKAASWKNRVDPDLAGGRNTVDSLMRSG